jgi:hypothetical protein
MGPHLLAPHGLLQAKSFNGQSIHSLAGQGGKSLTTLQARVLDSEVEDEVGLAVAIPVADRGDSRGRFRFTTVRAFDSHGRPRPPSPTSTNGAQAYG